MPSISSNRRGNRFGTVVLPSYVGRDFRGHSRGIDHAPFVTAATHDLLVHLVHAEVIVPTLGGLAVMFGVRHYLLRRKRAKG
jgi:hypothetical protein